MSRATTVVTLKDGRKFYSIYDGTVDVNWGCLAKTEAEAWEVWQKFYKDTYDPAKLFPVCECAKDPVLQVWSAYGGGFELPNGRVCLTHMVLETDWDFEEQAYQESLVKRP
jgi:hypothetical protein